MEVKPVVNGNLSLGPCCCCGKKGKRVRNVITLNKLSPVPSHGWGCLQCGLPLNGALAVVCDSCMHEHEGEPLDTWLKWACRGDPPIDGRIPFAELEGEFDHDMEFHPEACKGV